jgi:SAM-dependent methyltransferase
MATRAASRRGSGARFYVDDFGNPALYTTRLPVGRTDVVYLIESFVHATDPDTIFEGAATLLAPDGRLVICDDVLTSQAAADTEPVHTFRRGWHAHSLLTEEEIAERAGAAGLRLRENRDLTSYVELERPRDRVIRVIAPLIPRLNLRGPFWENMHGGDALQRALLSGLVAYRYMVFDTERSSSESPTASSASSTRPSRR